MSGTFTLQIGGNDISVSDSTDLDFDVASWRMRSAIQNTIAGMENVDVIRKGDPD